MAPTLLPLLLLLLLLRPIVSFCFVTAVVVVVVSPSYLIVPSLVLAPRAVLLLFGSLHLKYESIPAFF